MRRARSRPFARGLLAFGAAAGGTVATAGRGADAVLLPGAGRHGLPASDGGRGRVAPTRVRLLAAFRPSAISRGSDAASTCTGGVAVSRQHDDVDGGVRKDVVERGVGAVCERACGGV